MPTFDEWFVQKNGASFDELYMQPSQRHDNALRALAQALREYVSEMVKR